MRVFHSFPFLRFLSLNYFVARKMFFRSFSYLLLFKEIKFDCELYPPRKKREGIFHGVHLARLHCVDEFGHGGHRGGFVRAGERGQRGCKAVQQSEGSPDLQDLNLMIPIVSSGIKNNHHS